jgi:hypothetical protein
VHWAVIDPLRDRSADELLELVVAPLYFMPC